MGLEMVEVVMGVEEAFDIEIPDEECGFETPGELLELVVTKLRGERSQRCVGTHAFYSLRRTLMAWGIPREQVTTDAPLSSTLGGRNRRKQWQLLWGTLGWDMPGLVRGRGTVAAYVVLTAASAWAALIATESVYAGLAAGAISALLLGWLTLPLATVVPEPCATLRGAVNTALRRQYGRLAAEAGLVNEEEVWNVLQNVICERLLVTPDKVTRQARFYRDLAPDG